MKFLNKINQKINQVTLKSIISETMANIRYNTKYTKNASSIAELKGKFSDKIGVVVGSGPSLRKIDQTKYLKKYKESDSVYSDIETNKENSLFDTDVIDEYF